MTELAVSDYYFLPTHGIMTVGNSFLCGFNQDRAVTMPGAIIQDIVILIPNECIVKL